MSIYIPPATNAVDFAAESFTPADLTPANNPLSATSPAARTAVDFALSGYTQSTYPYVGWELLPGAGSVTATLAWTEDSDVFAVAGSVRVSAALAWTEADDTFAASGTVAVTSALAWTEDDDVTAITGSVTSSAVTADIAWTEDDDVWAITGLASSALISRSDGGEKRRSKKFRKKNEKRRSDLERAFAALMGSPEASVRAEAREIAAPALAQGFDAAELSDFRASQLLALYQEMQDEEDFLLLL